MSLCNVCPKNCNVNRNDKIGFCGADKNIKVAKAYLHEWEEPFISGTKGSGTVFFSHCNLKCVFCQNYKISAEGFGKNLSQDELYGVFKNLEQQDRQAFLTFQPFRTHHSYTLSANYCFA